MDTPVQDIAATAEGEEVAVAILLAGGNAFAFNSESYGHPGFANTAWKLDTGDYRIVISVTGSNVPQCKREFKLVYEDDDFSKFRLRDQ